MKEMLCLSLSPHLSVSVGVSDLSTDTLDSLSISASSGTLEPGPLPAASSVIPSPSASTPRSLAAEVIAASASKTDLE